jgi:hypothetical protein
MKGALIRRARGTGCFENPSSLKRDLGVETTTTTIGGVGIPHSAPL